MSSREFGRTCPLRPGTRWRGHHRVRHRIQRSERWTPSLIASSYGPLQSAGGVPFSQELLVKAERYNCVPPRGARISVVRDRPVSGVVAGRAGAGPSPGPSAASSGRSGAVRGSARMGPRSDGSDVRPLAIPDAANRFLRARRHFPSTAWASRPTGHGSLYAGRRVRPSRDGGPIPPSAPEAVRTRGSAPHRGGRTPAIPPAGATGLRRLRHDR